MNKHYLSRVTAGGASRRVRRFPQPFMKTVLTLMLTVMLGLSAVGDHSGRGFGFADLEIYDFKPGTSELRVLDINGNGRDEIIFINNHASRIEVLVRKTENAGLPEGALPALEDKFVNAGFLVDQQILFSALADLNRNGRYDLVAFGHALGLQIWIQNADNTFARPLRLHVDRLQDVVGLRLADVSGNGLPDIVLCRRGGAEIIWNAEEFNFTERAIIPVSGEACTRLEILDMTGNGRNDLLFFTQTPDAPIRVRTSQSSGGFEMETLLHVPPLRYADIFDASGNGEAPRLGAILHSGLGFRSYTFTMEKTPRLLDAQHVVAGRIMLEGTDRRFHPVYAIADINTNGYDDVIVGAPELSRLHVYHGGPQGLSGAPEPFDSLTGINAVSHLADARFLVVSRREQTAAIHDLSHGSVFPDLVKLPGNVLTGTSTPRTGRLFFVCRDDDRNFQLVELETPDAQPVMHEIDIRNEPSEMLTHDPGDGTVWIMLFAAHADPVMFIAQDGQALVRVAAADFPALASQLARRHVRPLPDDGDILVASGRTARRFQRTDSGYQAKRQYNPANPQADIVAACRFVMDDQRAGIMIYDQNARNLVWFDAEDRDAPRSIHLQSAPGEIFGLEALRGPDHNQLLIVARDSLNLVLPATERLTLAQGAEYMSVADQPSLRYFRPVTLGTPPRQYLALVDSANRAIEWIRKHNGTWRRDLAFEVFQDSGFGSGAPSSGIEPRAVAAGDLNGNGIGDMVLLVHDKLIVYPGAARK